MRDVTQGPMRVQLLESLRRGVGATYGEERAAKPTVEFAIQAAATALFRVLQEDLDLSDLELAARA